MNRAESRRVPRPIAETIGKMRRAVIRFFLVGGLNKILLALFALHIGAVLFHHMIRRDTVLYRIL